MRKSLGALTALGLLAVVGTAAAEPRDSRVVYNSIPRHLPQNVASVGPEAYAFRELGDGMISAPGAGGTIDHVTVVLSSWGCTSGNWFSGNCVTSPKNATFSIPITLKIYTVVDVGGVPTPGTLLLTQTKTFKVPYRPSSEPSKCGGDNQVWYSDRDKTCYHGLSAEIDFDLDSKVKVPDRMIIGVSYNSTHYGPNPIGEGAPCYSTTAGCPYDSLNIGTDGPGGLVGSVIDPNGIFVNYVFPSSYCQPHNYTGNMLQLDTGPNCWTGYHPLIKIIAETRGRFDRRDNRRDPRDP